VPTVSDEDSEETRITLCTPLQSCRETHWKENDVIVFKVFTFF